MAQVHRFRDKVAVYVGKGETVYFDAKSARDISRAINKVCRSIERESFAESSDTTFHIEEPKGH